MFPSPSQKKQWDIIISKEGCSDFQLEILYVEGDEFHGVGFRHYLETTCVLPFSKKNVRTYLSSTLESMLEESSSSLITDCDSSVTEYDSEDIS